MITLATLLTIALALFCLVLIAAATVGIFLVVASTSPVGRVLLTVLIAPPMAFVFFALAVQLYKAATAL